MLDQTRRRWAEIKAPLVQRLVFAGMRDPKCAWKYVKKINEKLCAYLSHKIRFL